VRCYIPIQWQNIENNAHFIFIYIPEAPDVQKAFQNANQWPSPFASAEMNNFTLLELIFAKILLLSWVFVQRDEKLFFQSSR
jgi:hypothetical protein